MFNTLNITERSNKETLFLFQYRNLELLSEVDILLNLKKVLTYTKIKIMSYISYYNIMSLGERKQEKTKNIKRGHRTMKL